MDGCDPVLVTDNQRVLNNQIKSSNHLITNPDSNCPPSVLVQDKCCSIGESVDLMAAAGKIAIVNSQ